MPAFCLAATLGLLAACTASTPTVTSDLATGSAAGAVDPARTHQLLAKDTAGVRLNSASTGATSPPGQ